MGQNHGSTQLNSTHEP